MGLGSFLSDIVDSASKKIGKSSVEDGAIAGAEKTGIKSSEEAAGDVANAEIKGTKAGTGIASINKSTIVKGAVAAGVAATIGVTAFDPNSTLGKGISNAETGIGNSLENTLQKIFGPALKTVGSIAAVLLALIFLFGIIKFAMNMRMRRNNSNTTLYQPQYQGPYTSENTM